MSNLAGEFVRGNSRLLCAGDTTAAAAASAFPLDAVDRGFGERISVVGDNGGSSCFAFPFALPFSDPFTERGFGDRDRTTSAEGPGPGTGVFDLPSSSSSSSSSGVPGVISIGGGASMKPSPSRCSLLGLPLGVTLGDLDPGDLAS